MKIMAKSSIDDLFQDLNFVTMGSYFSSCVLAFCGKVLVVGSYRGGLCGKRSGAAATSNRDIFSHLQNRPTAGQS